MSETRPRHTVTRFRVRAYRVELQGGTVFRRRRRVAGIARISTLTTRNRYKKQEKREYPISNKEYPIMKEREALGTLP
ncbi:MAG: hypothetical protein WC567_00605 [Kiritimatiellia bacterium]